MITRPSVVTSQSVSRHLLSRIASSQRVSWPRLVIPHLGSLFAARMMQTARQGSTLTATSPGVSRSGSTASSISRSPTSASSMSAYKKAPPPPPSSKPGSYSKPAPAPPVAAPAAPPPYTPPAANATAMAVATKRAPPPPPGAKPAPKPPVVHYVVALYDFEAQADGDLSFRTGDQIELLEKTNSSEDWWTGRLNGQKGVFPGT